MSKRKKKVANVNPYELTDAVLSEIKKDPERYAKTATIDEVAHALRSFSWTYYNTGSSSVSDADFDKMRDTLKERDPENEFLKEIGAPVAENERNKATLPYPMASLDKIKPDKGNLDSWLKKHPGPYVVSDKLDGVSLQLHKAGKNKFQLFTRGDGLIGGDVSHLLKYLMPKTVNKDMIPVGTSIRGEAIISRNNFKLIADKMKNARNATSGLVVSKTVDEQVASLVEFIAYSIMYPEYKQNEQMELLKKWGFKVVNNKVLSEFDNALLTDELKTRREKSAYEVDGIVVIDSSKPYKVSISNPSYGFAFKTVLADQQATATVKNVHWDVTMDGYLKPRIEIEPVELTGVTVKFATAHNGQYVVENKLGPGAKIIIIRSGDVIPYIQEILKPAKEPQLPDVAYTWTASGVDMVLKDVHGAQADAVAIRLILHFCKALGVKNISEGIITKLVNNGYKDLPSIIGANREELTKIEGLGSKTVEKIYKNLEDALDNTDLPTFMDATHSFGRLFGHTRFSEILKVYPDLMTKKWTKKEMTDAISNMKGFSSNTGKQFAEHWQKFLKLFNEINKVHDISHLKKAMKIIPEKADEEVAQECKELVGANVVFTGFRDKDLEQKVKDCKGRVSSGVSSKTKFVVALDTSGESSKLKDARDLGIIVMSKSDFIKKYNLGE